MRDAPFLGTRTSEFNGEQELNPFRWVGGNKIFKCYLQESGN